MTKARHLSATMNFWNEHILRSIFAVTRFFRFSSVSSGLLLAVGMLEFQASAADAVAERQLAGVCLIQQLSEKPFSSWYSESYEAYRPNAKIIESLHKTDFREVRIRVFFGSWCGDSRREVPRLLKVLSQLPIKPDAIELIAVSREDQELKQSPTHEERGLDIFRVPVVIVDRSGRELNRIVEYPVESLERDLDTILAGRPYVPNYPVFEQVRGWLKRDYFADDNLSLAGLAAQVRPLIASDGELHSCGNVLLAQGLTNQAYEIHQINRELYTDHTRPWAGLARVLHRMGHSSAALTNLQHAIEINRDPTLFESLWKLHATIREAADPTKR